MELSLPALAHRVTVFGSTRNAAATSAGVSSGFMDMVWVLLTLRLSLFNWRGPVRARSNTRVANTRDVSQDCATRLAISVLNGRHIRFVVLPCDRRHRDAQRAGDP